MEDIHAFSNDFLEQYKSTSNKSTLIENYLQKLLYADVESPDTVSDFPLGVEWMNTTKPLSIYSDLEGKLIILEFFTYCCINCIHVQSELRKLEELFSVEDGLVIIGVHSAKFQNEKITANVNNAVRRYNITHPVVNDSQNIMWNALSVCCWPTLFIIGPHGKPLLVVQGEGFTELMQLFVKHALRMIKDTGKLNNRSLPELKVTENLVNYGQLSYPGKITSFENRDESYLIAISDSGHHRILITTKDGIVKHIIGGSRKGYRDGDFKKVLFNTPQGLVFKDQQYLYVADTENHAIRQIDLINNHVVTVAGNGLQGCDYDGGHFWTKQTISSPWDLCFSSDNKNILYIAMAGIHQIWALFLEDDILWNKKKYKKGTCIAIAGSGREENRNNFYPKSSGFAQPSGLTYCSNPPSLFIADSESSTIRQLFLDDGKVSAVVGGSRDPTNLFQYGDEDGLGFDVKLQHPLAVAWNSADNKLYVADSYNHKIKEVTKPKGYKCVTLPLNFKFDEPSGLCIMKNELLIADTNNHGIKSLKLTDNSLSTFHIVIPKNIRSEDVLDEVDITLNNSGGTINVDVDVLLPAELTTKRSPGYWMIDLPDNDWKVLSGPVNTDEFQAMAKFVIKVPKNRLHSAVQVCFIGQVYLCMGDMCSVENMLFVIDVRFSHNGPEQVSCSFNHKIIQKQ